jgi:hypothetical protein
MPRSLKWIKSQNFHGFVCSVCNWKFNSSGTPVGASPDEMKRKYETQRDKEFAAHVCVTRTNTTYQKNKIDRQRTFDLPNSCGAQHVRYT